MVNLVLEYNKAIHLKEVYYKNKQDINRYPFNIPLIKNFDRLIFENAVTIFVGENGTGKSTLLEAIAAAAGSITVGAESVEINRELEPARQLANSLKLIWRIKTNKGFFLRAEDFLSYAKKLGRIKEDMEEEIDYAENRYNDRSAYAKSLAQLPYRNSIAALDSMYDGELNARSHGESFLKLFQSRLVANGLYILDEPETPLSPMNQFTLMSLIKEMTNQGCQFIVATHSPILMAFPQADIYSFDDASIEKVSFNEIEHIKFMKAFLNNPEKFIKYL
ncbi:AAA family ATPase [Desnuesiella massiliensis]|uniref:AAA family ATPase n=1 Tax=Desnuesiella massiliensis TaxID=1650662 RepID=UPI0006E1E8AA|nr:AAA family ATPase [Desnuesiella massiliensis]